MAKFVFKLQNILSIKEKLEDQAKAEYGMEIIKLREEEDCLKLLIHKKESYQQELKEALAQILVLFEIKKLEHGVEIVKDRIEMQKIIIKKQQKKVDQARDIVYGPYARAGAVPKYRDLPQNYYRLSRRNCNNAGV